MNKDDYIEHLRINIDNATLEVKKLGTSEYNNEGMSVCKSAECLSCRVSGLNPVIAWVFNMILGITMERCTVLSTLGVCIFHLVVSILNNIILFQLGSKIEH